MWYLLLLNAGSRRNRRILQKAEALLWDPAVDKEADQDQPCAQKAQAVQGLAQQKIGHQCSQDGLGALEHRDGGCTEVRHRFVLQKIGGDGAHACQVEDHQPGFRFCGRQDGGVVENQCPCKA